MCIRYHKMSLSHDAEKKGDTGCANVVGFWNFWSKLTRPKNHYSLPFCEQNGDFTAFLADLHNQKFAQQKLKQSGQKAWQSFWKPTLPAPIYPYLMMGLDLSGSSAACLLRGFSWECCHDVQLIRDRSMNCQTSNEH